MEAREGTHRTLRRRNPVDIIIRAARIYQERLSGNVFLYAFGSQYIEVEFPTENFRHLAGVYTRLSAERFFQLATKGELMPYRIQFTERHPYDLFLRKAKHLHEIAALTSSSCLVLQNIRTSTRKEKPFEFGLTNHSFTLCMGQNADMQGRLKNLHVVPYSLRDEDCQGRSEEQHPVTFILRKRADQKKYDTICYLDAEKTQQISKAIQTKMSKGAWNAIRDVRSLKDWQVAQKAFLHTFMDGMSRIRTDKVQKITSVLVRAARQSLLNDGLQADVKDYIERYAPAAVRGSKNFAQEILDKALQEPDVAELVKPEQGKSFVHST